MTDNWRIENCGLHDAVSALLSWFQEAVLKAIEVAIALSTASDQIIKVCSLCCKEDTRLGTGLTGKEVLAKIILYVYTVFIPDLFGT